MYSFQPPQTQLATSHQMERLIRKGSPAYITQCQEIELLTCEEDDYKPLEIQRANPKTPQGVLRVSNGAPAKQED